MFIRKLSSISLDSYVIFSRISRVKNTQNTTTYIPVSEFLFFFFKNDLRFFYANIYFFDFSMQIYIFFKKLAFVSSINLILAVMSFQAPILLVITTHYLFRLQANPAAAVAIPRIITTQVQAIGTAPITK